MTNGTDHVLRGTIVEGPRPPRCQKDVNPLALCWMTSTKGVQPLNMTSFLWVQIDQSVAKIVCHSASRRKDPPLRDCHHASSEVTTSRLTPAAYHTSWAKGQAKNRCEQSSTARAHNGHSTGESGTTRCRKDLVINRRRSRSQANTLIFRGITKCVVIQPEDLAFQVFKESNSKRLNWRGTRF